MMSSTETVQDRTGRDGRAMQDGAPAPSRAELLELLHRERADSSATSDGSSANARSIASRRTGNWWLRPHQAERPTWSSRAGASFTFRSGTFPRTSLVGLPECSTEVVQNGPS